MRLAAPFIWGKSSNPQLREFVPSGPAEITFAGWLESEQHFLPGDAQATIDRILLNPDNNGERGLSQIGGNAYELFLFKGHVLLRLQLACDLVGDKKLFCTLDAIRSAMDQIIDVARDTAEGSSFTIEMDCLAEGKESEAEFLKLCPDADLS